MADSVNMSLDDIIRAGRSRGRGGTGVRGRGRGAGRARGRGRGTRRGRSQTRNATPESQQGRPGSRARTRSRSRSRSQVGARGGRGRGRGRPQPRGRSRSRSRSRQPARSASRARSTSRLRGQTPVQNRLFRGGSQVRRSGFNPNLQGNIHSRLGVTTRRGLANNVSKPISLAKRGISKRGRGLTTRNRYSMVGLRSDQILKEQRQNMLLQNNVIRSQTFTRSRNNSVSRNNSRSRNNSLSRNNSFNSATQLTVSVANDLAKRRRRNSSGNINYLNEQSLVQLAKQLGGFRNRGGPGSVNSVGSNRSNKSTASARSARARGRARGRGRGRGVSGRFAIKPVLNAKLQREIAAIQGKATDANASTTSDSPSGINCTPTPASTTQTLHQRFACS